MSRSAIPPYRRLAIYIIWQAVLDQDEEFFHTSWFEALADMLGYSAEGMRDLALEKIAEIRRQRHAHRRRGSGTQKDRNGAVRC